MNTLAPGSDRHPCNPFATRHTRPGSLPPLDRDGALLDVGAILAVLERHRRVAIVGPHGTGKSTLLVTLADQLADAGRPAEVIRLRRRRDAVGLLMALWGSAGTTLLVDGWEQLGRPSALLVATLARLLGRSMVVTSHRRTGLREAVRTVGTLPLLRAIVARLPAHRDLIAESDLADTCSRHRGNLRDALADLYDRYEQRSRRS